MNTMIKIKARVWSIALAVFLSLPAASVHAVGTPSGTVINNTATVTYNSGLSTGLTATVSATLTVDNKVNVVVTKNGDANVMSGAVNQALIFIVTNTGNTTQRYALSVINGATGIPMSNVRIFKDNGMANTWDSTDTLYLNAGTFGDIPADGSLKALIVADTPAVAVNGATDDYTLVAATVDAGTLNISSQTAGPNTAGVDVVFADSAGNGDGARDGKHSATGRYTVVGLKVNLVKSVLVYSDPVNGTTNPKPVSGAILRYTVTATVTGGGTVLGVVVTDPVPANSTYQAGTLKLNGVSLSDAVDADKGDIGGTTAGTVTVNLGDLTSATPVQTITFDVKIN